MDVVVVESACCHFMVCMHSERVHACMRLELSLSGLAGFSFYCEELGPFSLPDREAVAVRALPRPCSARRHVSQSAGLSSQSGLTSGDSGTTPDTRHTGWFTAQVHRFTGPLRTCRVYGGGAPRGGRPEMGREMEIIREAQ